MTQSHLSTHVAKICSAFFSAPETTSVVLTRIQKRLSHAPKYSDYALAQELRIAGQEILQAENAHPRMVEPEALMQFETESEESRKLAQISTLLARLPARDRLALLMLHGAEIDPETVAIALDTPKASLDLMLASAHEAIATWLWPEHPDASKALREKLHRAIAQLVSGQDAPNVNPVEPSSSKTAARRERWRRLPWTLRIGIEAAAIGLFVFLITLAVPKVQTIVERRLQNKLDQFNMAEVPPSGTQAQASLDTTPNTTQDQGSALESDDEELTEDESSTPDPSRAAKQGEIWRFLIRADIPRDAKKRVSELLSGIKVEPALTPEEIKGIEVPGGIQFNVVLPPERVLEIKDPLQGLSTKTSIDPVLRPPFSWYRSRSKVPLPTGRVRVVIWISQL